MNEVKLFQKSNYYKRDRKINSTMPSLFVKFDGHQFTLKEPHSKLVTVKWKCDHDMRALKKGLKTLTIYTFSLLGKTVLRNLNRHIASHNGRPLEAAKQCCSCPNVTSGSNGTMCQFLFSIGHVHCPIDQNRLVKQTYFVGHNGHKGHNGQYYKISCYLAKMCTMCCKMVDVSNLKLTF